MIMEKENREYKDSLFVDLFYQDETAKKNLLSVYNALHDTEYQDENVIRKMKIEDVLHKNFKNDISFEIDGQVLVMGEQLSTVNLNIPLRCLLYVGKMCIRDRYNTFPHTEDIARPLQASYPAHSDRL